MAVDALLGFDKLLLGGGISKLGEGYIKFRDIKLKEIMAVGRAYRFGSNDYDLIVSEKCVESVHDHG